MEKWIVKQNIHLGFIRQTVGKGTIIEHDTKNNILLIDGNVFDCSKDLQILKNNNFVDPFKDSSAESILQEAEKESKERNERILEHKGKTNDQISMPIIKDDSDEHKIIDISHTKKNYMPKEIKNDMEIIKGDEDIKNRQVSMPIVKDDSIGFSTNEPSLNETKKPKTLSIEEHEKIRKENLEKAKKGFVDERIAKAMEAANSINKVKTETKTSKKKIGRPKNK